jgi:diguanylate cyclase (GGDEF)-like protein/PAS domain S-box-containing protein
MCRKSIQACEKEYLEKLVALCPDGIIAIDRSGTITVFNQAAEVLTGRRARDIVGRMNITELYGSPEAAREIKKNIYAETFGDPGRLENYEVTVNRINGSKVPIRLSATLIHKNEEEIGSVGFFHDLTARKGIEEKLRQLSITDSLTGLYNQRYFHVCMAKELERAKRYERSLSLICCDIDHFKQCNDILGHLEGDNVLRLIGKLLAQNLRQTDMAFRYGGDEFFILLPETALDSATQIAEKIRQLFNSQWPYDVEYDGTKVEKATLSIGTTLANPSDNTEQVIKRADVAMYSAKRQGGDRVIAYANDAAATG